MMSSSKIESKVNKKTFSPDSKGMDSKLQGDQKHIPIDWWFEDVCMLDINHFVRTVAAIKSKGARPDLIGAIITHYALKCLPGLVREQEVPANLLQDDANSRKIGNRTENGGSESFSSMQRRNKFILETLISILPAERDAVSCSFLLRLLRVANILGVDSLYKIELEKRIGPQLEKATLSDLLIPSFSHTSDTLFDVQLVYRLVKRFLAEDENRANAAPAAGRSMGASRLPTSMVRVAKLMDSYLAEIAYDVNLDVSSFEALADGLPCDARTCDDGLYRAIDTYLKTHSGISEVERRRLCRLMDCQKLSADACFHAAQNERLPIRTVVHVLFCEQMRLKNAKDVEETTRRGPGEQGQCQSHGCNTGNNPSQIGSDYIHNDSSMYSEIQKIREDFAKLRHFCIMMQQQVDKICKQKSSFPWSNGWKKLAKISNQFQSSKNRNSVVRDEHSSVADDVSVENPWPAQAQMPQTRHKGTWRRHSLS